MNPDLLVVLLLLLAFSPFLLIGIIVAIDNERTLKRMEESGLFDKKESAGDH